jgi:hypothetical protein
VCGAFSDDCGKVTFNDSTDITYDDGDACICEWRLGVGSGDDDENVEDNTDSGEDAFREGRCGECSGDDGGKKTTVTEEDGKAEQDVECADHISRCMMNIHKRKPSIQTLKRIQFLHLKQKEK